MRLGKIRPRVPLRPRTVWGRNWDCDTCGLKPYRHSLDPPHGGSFVGTQRRRCETYTNDRARRLLGWQEGSP